MASEFDQTEFVDTDFTPSKRAEESQIRALEREPRRPASREELELRVTETQEKLAKLKHEREVLERERAALEEDRRRRAEYQNGREEMLRNLTRGVGLLEQAEFAARRDSEQMAKTLADMREALQKVESLNEELWTQETLNAELTRALTTIENARMEWNSAQLKWTLLSADGAPDGQSKSAPNNLAALTELKFSQLAKIGLAFTWPLVLVALGAAVAIVLLLMRR